MNGFGKLRLDGRLGVALFLLFAFFAFPSASQAQSTNKAEYLHQIWRAEEGLPDPIVRAICQSHDGYLWLATEESLLRFDGVRFSRFEQFTNVDKPDRWFTALIEAKDGTIWSSSPNGGLSRWKDGVLRDYRMKDGLPDNYVMSLCQDKQGTLWIGTQNGLSTLKGEQFISYTNQVPGLIVSSVRALLEDHAGNLWIGTAEGLCKKTGDQYTTYTTNNLLVNNSVMTLYEDSKNRLYVGTAKGLTVIDGSTVSHYTEADGLAHGTVRSVMEDHSGRIWIGTQGGVHQLANGKILPVSIQSMSDFDETISFIYTIYQDREDNIWIGTNLGLNRLKPQRFKTYTKDDGLGHNLTTLVYEDHTGATWIGTYGGGLSRIVNGQMTTFTTANGFPSAFVLALCEDHEGTLWIGTEGAGLVRYKDGKFTNFLQPGDLRVNIIRVIYEDSKGELWVGSNNTVGRFKDGTFTNEKVTVTTVRSIVEDQSHHIWIGSKTGLMEWNDGAIKTYAKKEGMTGIMVSALFPDGLGGLWVATDFGGLNYFKDGKFVYFGAAEGLFNERVLHIVEDDLGNLWMGTRSGVLSVSKKHLNELVEGKVSSVKFSSFAKKDGMKRAQCNGIGQPSGWKASDGHIWFPTMHGAVTFDPQAMTSNQLPPPVAIEKVTMDGKPVSLVNGATIPPGHGQLEIEYTALSFQQPEHVYFKYKLEGVDDDWQDAGTHRVAHYNNIDAGEYRFRVIACNNNGVWNEVGASFDFVVKPHFYERPAFYAGCVLLFFVGCFGVYHLRVRQLHRREQELSKQVADRTHALQQEINERKQAEEALRQSQEMVLRQERLAVVGQLAAGIAHEFNNILTVIQGHTCLLIANDHIPEADKIPLEKVSIAADRAANLTRQLLTFSRKQMMQVRSVDLNEIVGNMTSMLKRVLGEQVVLELNHSPTLPNISADPGMVEQIIINLVVNARDAMPKGGRLAITTSSCEFDTKVARANSDAHAGKFVCLTVSDSGTGIAPENLKKIFEPFFTTKEVGKGTGLGLATVYGIVKQHQGWIDVESELNRGTTFHVYLPIGVERTAPLTPRKEAINGTVRGGSETILVVEDEPGLKELAREILTRQGYKVLLADNGRQALTTFEQNPSGIDLLLTDMIMPEGLSGTDLAEKLNHRKPHLKVIFTSGYSSDVIGGNMKQPGKYFLAKPYQPLTLLRLVRECLDNGKGPH